MACGTPALFYIGKLAGKSRLFMFFSLFFLIGVLYENN